MRKLVLLIGTIIATVALAQNRRDATAPQPAPHSSATLIRTPAFSPSSLDQLTGKAELILDGEVEAVVPTRLANPNNPTSLETDSIISVNRALKGVTVQRVVVSQPGGKRGDLEIISNQDALMQKGERFILFLTRDNRANLPAIEGLPRFVITGAWSGKFKLDNGKIRTSPQAAPDIRSNENTNVDAFVSMIFGKIAH